MKFVGFIPVHNRCQKTLLCIQSLKHSLKKLPYEIWVIDDGSTDQTIKLLREQHPEIKIHELDGTYYWGGCINETNKILTKNYANEEVIVGLFNNDTIHFPSALDNAVTLLDTYSIVCPSVIHIASWEDVNFASCEENPCLQIKDKKIDFGSFFDTKHFKFSQNKTHGLTNISHTVGLITRKDVYLEFSKVPVSIPHYLSDYYMTHRAVCLGNTIYISPHYLVFRLDNQLSDLKNRSPDNGLVSWAKASLSVKEVAYLPAWIRFRTDFSRERLKHVHLFIMHFKLMIAKIISFLWKYNLRE